MISARVWTETTPRARSAPKKPTRVRFRSRTSGFSNPTLIKSLSAVAEDAERLVRKAFAQGYIQIVTPGSQLSPSSLEIKWEEELRALIKGEGFFRFRHEVSVVRLLISIRLLPTSTGIPSTKDLKEVKDKLKQKQKSWAEEERARARGKVRRYFSLSCWSLEADTPPLSVYRRGRGGLGGRRAETEKAQAARRGVRSSGQEEGEQQEVEAGDLFQRRRK